MKKFLSVTAATFFISSSAFAMKPFTIVNQGSFMAGGKVITATTHIVFIKFRRRLKKFP